MTKPTAQSLQPDLELKAINAQLRVFVRQDEQLLAGNSQKRKQPEQAGGHESPVVPPSGRVSMQPKSRRQSNPLTGPEPVVPEDPNALAQDVQAFMKHLNMPENVMPSMYMLRQAQQQELSSRIQRYGGLARLANHMGYQLSSSVAYRDFALVVKDVQAFVQQQVPAERDAVMPSVKELKQAGQHCLAKYVQRHGSRNVAQAAGLTCDNGKTAVSLIESQSTAEDIVF